jgi:hypothetical protein
MTLGHAKDFDRALSLLGRYISSSIRNRRSILRKLKLRRSKYLGHLEDVVVYEIAALLDAKPFWSFVFSFLLVNLLVFALY